MSLVSDKKALIKGIKNGKIYSLRCSTVYYEPKDAPPRKSSSTFQVAMKALLEEETVVVINSKGHIGLV